MTTGCEFYADALVERATGVLEPGRAARLDEHLNDCPECAAGLRVVMALKASPLEVPAGLEDRIRSAVRAAARPAAPAPSVERSSVDRRRVGRWRPWALPLAAAATLVAVWVGIGAPGVGREDAVQPAVVVFEEYEPYGAWPADGPFVAGQPVLSELSVEELELLLREMET
jgi:anti-sigma factor RsiW